jgi:hypothetical protein
MKTSGVFLIKSKFILKEPVMSAEIKQNVDTNSTEFNEGVEAGLNSAQDTKNWKAGNKLGQELKEEAETEEPVYKSPATEASTPLFMMDSPESDKGNAQDEKDEAGE